MLDQNNAYDYESLRKNSVRGLCSATWLTASKLFTSETKQPAHKLFPEQHTEQ